MTLWGRVDAVQCYVWKLLESEDMSVNDFKLLDDGGGVAPHVTPETLSKESTSALWGTGYTQLRAPLYGRDFFFSFLVTVTLFWSNMISCME